MNWAFYRFIFFDRSLLLFLAPNLDERVRLWLQQLLARFTQVVVLSHGTLVSNAHNRVHLAVLAPDVLVNGGALGGLLLEELLQEGLAFFAALLLHFVGNSFFKFF